MVGQATEDTRLRPALGGGDAGGLKFSVAPAEKIPLDGGSCQLILVGRAIHYFDQASFFKEVPSYPYISFANYLESNKK